jgi:hypothetical protein
MMFRQVMTDHLQFLGLWLMLMLNAVQKAYYSGFFCERGTQCAGQRDKAVAHPDMPR